MFLKLIIFGVIGVVIYRALGGKVPILDRGGKPQDKLDSDTLVECSSCGTYVTVADAITVSKRHYCSKECLPG